MSVSIIAAIAENGVIGTQGDLPWHLPDDLRRFKSRTMGHTIIMGRKTHESIGRALPGRRNVVVSRQPGYQAEGCEVAHSLEVALAEGNEDEIFCIGGAELYRLALPLADRMYLTRIFEEFDGDVHFPAWDEAGWSRVRTDAGQTEPIHYQFETWEKNL